MTSGKQGHSCCQNMSLHHGLQLMVQDGQPKNKSYLLPIPPSKYRTCKRPCDSSLLHLLLARMALLLLDYPIWPHILIWCGGWLGINFWLWHFVLLQGPSFFVISYSPGFLFLHIASQAIPEILYTKAGFQKVKMETLRPQHYGQKLHYVISYLFIYFCANEVKVKQDLRQEKIDSPAR